MKKHIFQAKTYKWVKDNPMGSKFVYYETAFCGLKVTEEDSAFLNHPSKATCKVCLAGFIKHQKKRITTASNHLSTASKTLGGLK